MSDPRTKKYGDYDEDNRGSKSDSGSDKNSNIIPEKQDPGKPSSPAPKKPE